MKGRRERGNNKSGNRIFDINYEEIFIKPKTMKTLGKNACKLTGVQGTGLAGIAAVAIGSAALGAFAIGALAIAKLAIKKASVKELSVGTLTVDKLIIKSQHGEVIQPS